MAPSAPSPPPLEAPTPELLERLSAIVGDKHAISDGDAQALYLREWRGRYRGRAAVVLRPGSTAEVSAILASCLGARVGVVPQGGNTGLVGGQIPDASGRQIVMSLSRLDHIRGLDAGAGILITEAGVTLANVRAAADAVGRQFPVSLASEGSCQIGGILATNAGGVAVLRHGTARANALGLEVVLADGRIWDGLRMLKKDNSGYDLKDLFIGAEGTLGVITAAVLKLAPKPVEIATAFAAVPSLAALERLFHLAEARAGPSLTAFEFMSERALSFVTSHIAAARAPFAAAAPWFALLDLAGHAPDGRAGEDLEALLQAAQEAGFIIEATIAQSLTQSAQLWRLREAMSEAQKCAGVSLKHDISVPVARIAEFVSRANASVETLCPGARPVPFGHFGDGNVHYNISEPARSDNGGADLERFIGRGAAISEAVHALCVSLGGSISAEHGIGQMKRAALKCVKSPLELELMWRLKAAFDPRGILNPGKLLPEGDAHAHD